MKANRLKFGYSDLFVVFFSVMLIIGMLASCASDSNESIPESKESGENAYSIESGYAEPLPDIMDEIPSEGVLDGPNLDDVSDVFTESLNASETDSSVSQDSSDDMDPVIDESHLEASNQPSKQTGAMENSTFGDGKSLD